MSELRDKTSELEERLAELETFFGVDGLREEAEELGEQMSRPGFWDDQDRARQVSARFSRVENRIKLLENLRGSLSDSGVLLELADGDLRGGHGARAHERIIRAHTCAITTSTPGAPRGGGRTRRGPAGGRLYQAVLPSPWGTGRGSSRTTGTEYMCAVRR